MTHEGADSGSISAAAQARSRAMRRYGSTTGASDYGTKYERSWSKRRTHRRETSILSGYLARFDASAGILNVPCGGGRFTDIIRPSARTHAVYGDNASTMLDEARRNLEATGDDRVELRQIDVLGDQPTTRHELVLCVRLLHHLKDDAALERALDFLCRSAERGLVFTFASSSTVKGWTRRIRRRLGGRARGERILGLSRVREELRRRGWNVAAVRWVDRLFSSQTWVLALPTRDAHD